VRRSIEKDRPEAARQIAEKITSSAEMLLTYPAMGRPGRVAHTRELVVTNTPYIMPYRVKGQSIELLRVLHGAMKWPKNL
jgi:plasmid stabilization system protein ParE